MYQSKLLDAYKKAQNYIQDKQIAHDLNVSASRICEMRKGTRYISDAEAIFLAQGANVDPQIALLGCHSDRNENPQVKAIWEDIAKKCNGLGLSGISTTWTGLTVLAASQADQMINFALCILC